MAYQLSSSEFMERARAWFGDIFEHPEQTRIYGFHPCGLFLNPIMYYDPFVVPNIGPAFLGGTFDGCWCMTFAHDDEIGVRYWLQHGENPEARRSFDWPERDVYPPFRQPITENPVSLWIAEIHCYTRDSRIDAIISR